ncbi:unnamed protein product, partial [Nesidiocoris tenuis]
DHKTQPMKRFNFVIQLAELGPLADLAVGSFVAIYNPKRFFIHGLPSFYVGPHGVIAWLSISHVPFPQTIAFSCCNNVTEPVNSCSKIHDCSCHARRQPSEEQALVRTDVQPAPASLPSRHPELMTSSSGSRVQVQNDTLMDLPLPNSMDTNRASIGESPGDRNWLDDSDDRFTSVSQAAERLPTKLTLIPPKRKQSPKKPKRRRAISESSSSDNSIESDSSTLFLKPKIRRNPPRKNEFSRYSSGQKGQNYQNCSCGKLQQRQRRRFSPVPPSVLSQG